MTALPLTEDVGTRLSLLLSIHEPLLINDLNLEKAMQPREKYMDNLMAVTKLSEGFKQSRSQVEDGDSRLKVPVYLKYAVRCLTSCIRQSTGLVRFVDSPEAVS